MAVLVDPEPSVVAGQRTHRTRNKAARVRSGMGGRGEATSLRTTQGVGSLQAGASTLVERVECRLVADRAQRGRDPRPGAGNCRRVSRCAVSEGLGSRPQVRDKPLLEVTWDWLSQANLRDLLIARRPAGHTATGAEQMAAETAVRKGGVPSYTVALSGVGEVRKN